MAKGHTAKIKGMHGNQNRKVRGRASITGTTARDLGPRKTHPNTPQELRREVNRAQGPRGGKHRGDRRGKKKHLPNKTQHKGRGDKPRPGGRRREGGGAGWG